MFEPITLNQSVASLTDDQWDAVKDHFDCRRRRKHSIRNVIDAILYVIDKDIHWRMLPGQFAPWQTVYYYYDKWKKDGAWRSVLDVLPDDIRIKAIASAYASPYPTVDVHVIKTQAQPGTAHIHSFPATSEAKPEKPPRDPVPHRSYSWILRDFLTPEEDASQNQAA
jgi:transposase